MSAQAGTYGTLFAREPGAPAAFWTSLRYFCVYRILLAGVFLVFAGMRFEAVAMGAHRPRLFGTVAIAYLAAAVGFYAWTRAWRERFNLQLSAHAATDVVAITLLMHASGGVRSGLGATLVVALIGAALLAPRRLSLAYAALATLALLAEQTYWVLVHDVSETSYLAPALLAVGCFAAAGVTGWLAQRAAASESRALEHERALALQMRVNQLVIDDLPDGVLVADRQGRVLQCNPQARRLLGLAVGTPLATLVPGLAADWLAGRRPDGSMHEFEFGGRSLRLRRLEGVRGEDYAVLYVEDLTRLREQAQQLKLAALGRLTANLAHEVRNPLSAISHAAELLEEEQRSADRWRLTRIIRDNAQRLERLVSDVLQLSRRSRVAQRLELAAFVRTFAEEFAAVEGLAPERLEALASDAEVWIEFDPEHLRQVLWNLLHNAVRHARTVRIEARKGDGRVELNVMDDGPGVPPADQGKLFEPFFTTEPKGTGLGLYLARELCLANGAWLEYVAGGKGAHFRLSAPLAQP